MSPWMIQGKEDAEALLPLLRSRQDTFTSDEQALLWWAGFLAAIRGYCSASIGPAAEGVIEERIAEIVARIVN